MGLRTPARPRVESRDAQLLAAQFELMSGVVAGQALGAALEDLLRVVERVSTGGLLASVLLLDEDGRHLLHGAAPSLPEEYNAAIHGIEIGDAVGSCGTAAWRRQQVIVEDIGTDPLWADFRDLALDAGLRACWSTPIFGAGGRLLGTFALYYPQPSRPAASDLALIDVLVRSVAMAIDRSRHDEQRERELAEERALGLAFQRSLLPQLPSSLGRVELAARYRTGDPGVHVGGDWFDAVEVPDGVVLVVGDVQGHDIEAAALMGQLRTVVRAAVGEGHPPSGVLARAAAYLDGLDSDLLATVLVVHLDVRSHLATVACAGHLPPMALGVRGSESELVEVRVETGPPLGIGERWEERVTRLPSDAVLLLYTDGLVETRTWDIDEGIDRLAALLERLPATATPDRLLDAALGLLPAGNRGDDVAVLAARVPPREEDSDRCVSRELPALPMSVPLARSWTAGWLAERAPGHDPDSVLLAVSELVTNAIRQGDGNVQLTLTAEGGADGAVLVEVFDRGHRLPRVDSLGDDATSGRGLRLVDAVCTSWGVDEEDEGKTVWARIGR